MAANDGRSYVFLSTFKKWNLGDQIGFETSEDNSGRKIVHKVWCKLCARHSNKIRKDLKGRSQREVDKYIAGTGFITKYTITRHFNSKTHGAAYFISFSFNII